ncbi:thiamine/thiamine pyrophosphate ABC transporter permease ThiP [Rhizobium sp. CG5]|uniref:thiamine/thiamine pyrophosphate ABC transporter permease ThiP n=1 Tax=Rhizobium sp. CG5 TaxID=2726076 RepID=UPI0020337013|nr:thiamine/thiamine pyrophosphate ABC transporter permease ThiP [Rhizobium sp. CG5]MCM2477130.1 thiamine/thiamine pyrophosphate ABC transporter permease ThiP [Rhizobium sp. CG5]
MLTRRERWTAIAGGTLSLAGLLLFIAAAVVSLLMIGTETGSRPAFMDPVVLSILRFTLLQAALSTALSLLFALPVARALARQPQFWGRRWLVRLLALPMGLPVLIGALGLIGVWGRQGVVNDGLRWIGISEPFSIYGLSGILLAHVFFNMPLAARLMLAGLERVPAEYWQMSASLGMRPLSVFRFIEWPALRPLLPGIAGLIFMLCATSFTLVLVLGGGPAATTIEVAIYQALRFDFDPGRAVSLALLQIALTAFVLGAMALFPNPQDQARTDGHATRRFDGKSPAARLADTAMLTVAFLFLAAPLAAITLSGLQSDLPKLVSQPAFLKAAATSLAIAFSAALLSLAVSMAFIEARAALGMGPRAHVLARVLSTAIAAASFLVFLVPAIVLATGWFLLLRPAGDIGRFAPVLVVVINMLMALPFTMRVLAPAVEIHRHRTTRLCASLGISGLARWRLIDWPALKRPFLTALSFAMALSLGDLGAVALFGSENLTTLPWLIYSRMGNYRSDDADGLALLLGLVCLALTIAGTSGASAQVREKQ